MERYFDSSVLQEDKNIPLTGYNKIRADHPSNAKGSGVCIFYKETLGVHFVNLSSFTECIICEVSIQNNKGYIGVEYRSPSQDAIKFQTRIPYNFAWVSSTNITNHPPIYFHNSQTGTGVHKQVSIFNETLINIFSNFTPNKLVTFDDRDPTWMIC